MDECYAAIEEPGLFSYGCELPAGHEGQHVVHWDEDPPPPRPDVPISPGWAAWLQHMFSGPSWAGLLGGRDESQP